MTGKRELLLKCKRHMRKYFSARRSAGTAAGIALLVAAALAAILLCTGCGNNFRPVVNPELPAGGDPCSTASFVHVIAQGPSGTPGTASQIDVCGDFDAADMTVGLAPVHGALVNGIVFVANSADDDLSFYTSGSIDPGATSSVSFPSGSKPIFVGSTETGSTASVYAALSGAANPGGVAVVSTSSFASTTVSLPGETSVALAELADQSKVYVADSSGDVSVIQTSDHSLSTIHAVAGKPEWITANPDNSAVYVLDQVNPLQKVEIIDPSNNTAPNSVTAGKTTCGPTQTFCGFMYFDAILHRLYVINKDDNAISVFEAGHDASGPTLTRIGTPNTGTSPVSLTAVHTSSCDGCVYVANSGSKTVTVLDPSLNVIKAIAVGTTPVSIAASSDGTRVYVANNGSSNTSVIGTASNTVIQIIAAPSGNAPVWVVGF